MDKNNNENNNFRTLDGGSEKDVYRKQKRIPDTYSEILSGNHGHPVRSESSYDDTGLTRSREGHGLNGSVGRENFSKHS